MSGGQELASELRRMADVADSAGGGSRYVEAMAARAREIAERLETAADPGAALLDALRPAAARDTVALAASLRDGTVNEGNTPGLREALTAALREELLCTNPGFLQRREGNCE
ncbi:MAG: hypothetical protein AB7U38_02310 [Hyphomicrobiales bacterium]